MRVAERSLSTDRSVQVEAHCCFDRHCKLTILLDELGSLTFVFEGQILSGQVSMWRSWLSMLCKGKVYPAYHQGSKSLKVALQQPKHSFCPNPLWDSFLEPWHLLRVTPKKPSKNLLKKVLWHDALRRQGERRASSFASPKVACKRVLARLVAACICEGFFLQKNTVTEAMLEWSSRCCESTLCFCTSLSRNGRDND